MNINLIRLRSDLKNANDGIEQNDKYISKIFSSLPVTFNEKRNNNFSLLLIETGGTEEQFVKLLPDLASPIYLLTNGDNNSLAASLEILTYLKKHNYEGEVIHGDDEYVIKRISTLLKLEVGNIKRHLGVVGKPSNWLIASDVNILSLHNYLNCDLVTITFEEFMHEIDKKEYETNELIKEIKKHGFDENVLEGAFYIYGALKRLVYKYKLDGLTVRCFDLLTKYKNTSCLALALLNAEGIIATCEGDECAMVTMMIVRLLTSQSSFQVNPSRIDVSNKTGVFAHCSVPFDMIGEYKLDTHFESDLGVAIKGKLNLAPVTLLKVNSDISDIFISEGEIIENLDDCHLCRTQIKVKFSDPIENLLTAPYGNHHILVYGHIKNKLLEWLKNK